MPDDAEDEIDEGFTRITVALLSLLAGMFFIYHGVRGSIAFARSSAASYADPVIWILGLASGPWLIWTSLRIMRSAKQDAVLSSPELLVLSLVAMAGGVWAVTLGVLKGLGLTAIGLAGVYRWWTRKRAEKPIKTT